jgi:hypothetical protein
VNFYNFFRTPPDRGVGTGNDALAKPQTDPTYSIYGPRYNVQRSFIVTKPAHFKANQDVPFVPIEGNGAYIAGQYALQALTQTKKGASA